jgi:serine/threonine protein kinase
MSFKTLQILLLLQFCIYTSSSFLASIMLYLHPPRHNNLRECTGAVDIIYSRSLHYGDISCDNVFLDDNLNVKLGDFAGSAVDDLPPLICYETSHKLPGEDIPRRTDLFALGSTTYEIMTGSEPYKELPDHQVV